MSSQEMSWEDIRTGGGEGPQFLKLKNGDNKVRFVSAPYKVETHWEEALDGTKKKINCLGANCPICQAGKVPSIRYQAYVIDREDSKLKILESGPQVFGQVRDYAKDAEYGDPTQYDIKVKKEGSGRETKYTTLASPNKTPLNSELTDLVTAATPLAELNKPKSIEDIMAMGLKVLAESDAGLATNATDADDDWAAL